MAREILQKQPDLYEFANSVIIGSEFIDRNKHVGNSRYLDIYEKQRDLYMEACGVSSQMIREQLMRRMFMVDYSGSFKLQLFVGNQVTIFTSAQIEREQQARIRFRQRIVKDGFKTADFQCTVCVVDQRDRPTRLPDVIKDKINQANRTKQTKQ